MVESLETTYQIRKAEPRIERGVTKIIVPHKGKEASFVHPSQGPHNYQTVGRGVLARGLNVPNGDYTASLLHAAYCSDAQNEPEFNEIRDNMTNKLLWVFDRNLWTPEGVYVVYDKDAKGLSEPLRVNDLEKELKGVRKRDGIKFSSDGKVRFAPKDTYVLGEHTSESLAKDGFVRVSYGEEGAEKLGEVSASKHFKYKPRTFGVNVNEGEEPILRVASLDSYRGFGRGWLVVNGYGWSDGSFGYAFGVLK